MAGSTQRFVSLSQEDRIQNELVILQAIYPGQLRWLDRNRELVYNSEDGSLVLRLPDGYLIGTQPEVIKATGCGIDLRDQVQGVLLGRDPETEVLDIVIEEFRGLAEDQRQSDDVITYAEDAKGNCQAQSKATVIVWLHHLLNTKKRKQALSPLSDDIAGYTKPGYPGVLLLTGPSAGVYAHVQELKCLQWQAFQVRLETNVEWTLPHRGVVEVESISELVSELEQAHKAEFLSAMKIKESF